MKIIDNRYKVGNIIEDVLYYKSYRVNDLWNDNSSHILKLYNSNLEDNIIEYFIDNFHYLSSIKHKNLFTSNRFNLVNTIDAKKTTERLYYSVSEYSQANLLSDIVYDLSLEKRVEIILGVIEVIDYLHFRGYVYKCLNPEDIYVSNYGVKISDLATMVEKIEHGNFNKISTYFISPEVLLDGHDIKDKNIDYYSISVLIRYLLFEEYPLEDIKDRNIEKNIRLSVDQRYVVDDILDELTERTISSKELDLTKIMDRLIDFFKVDYSYDIIRDREHLYFNTKIVGRDSCIEIIKDLDCNRINKNTINRGVVYKGDPGIGKTRLISEIIHQLKFRDRYVYSVEILNDDNKGLKYISSLLKQSIKDAPKNLMDKYRDELSKILPELKVNLEEEVSDPDFTKKSDVFRLYNRVTNYFKELSSNRVIYLIIDDLQYMDSNGIALIDYLIRNIDGDNIFFIFSYEEDASIEDKTSYKYIKSWILEDIVNFKKIEKLNLENIGEMIKNILGVSSIPREFANVLYRESDGNPRYVEYMIKNLYTTEQLYISCDGLWHLSVEDYEDLYFPIDMYDATKKQLDIVKENHLDIFKVMSIFNNELSRKTIVKMLKRTRTEVDKELLELIRLKLVDRKVVDWGYSYSITSIEIKKQIYSELLEEEKIKLHKQATKIIEDNIKSGLDVVVEDYIYHLIRSNQSEKALELIFERVNKLENPYGAQALFLWEEAYDIVKLSSGDTKLKVLKNMLNIYSYKGEIEIDNNYLKEYIDEAKKMDNIFYYIDGMSISVEIYYRKLENQKALDIIDQILEISEEENYIEGIILGRTLKLRAYINLRSYEEIRSEITSLINMTENINSIKSLGSIYNIKGMNEFQNGKMEEALNSYRRSIDYFLENNMLIESTYPINNIGKIYTEYFSDSDKAMDNFERGLGIASRYGFQESEIRYLNNIGELYIKELKFDQALVHIQKAQKIALEIQSKDTIFLTNVNLGKINIATGDYLTAFEIYRLLNNYYSKNKITDIETKAAYHNFLSQFFAVLGSWEEAIRFTEKTIDLYSGFNLQEYLKNKTKLIYFHFLSENKLDRREIEEVLSSYERTIFIKDRRMAHILFTISCIFNNKPNYAKDLMEMDNKLVDKYDSEVLRDLKKLINAQLDLNKENIEKMIEIESRFSLKNIYNIGLLINILIGYNLSEVELYEHSIRYSFESLDSIYRSVLKIPEYKYKKSFIESRYGDNIKRDIQKSFYKLFNRKISYKELADINSETINDYFDLTEIFENISNEELSKITTIDNHISKMKVDSIEELIYKLEDDYKKNLDLILNYIGKETLATMGYILIYDDKIKAYKALSSLENSPKLRVNTNILNMASKDREGILLNNNSKVRSNYDHRGIIFGEIKGMICYPITTSSNGEAQGLNNRVMGYVYLETDKIFNRFDKKRLNIVENLAPLISINIQSYKLRGIATTDKLTGTYTRKYYEIKFEDIIKKAESNNEEFSVLMLDIDDFKDVNDTYGHLKGDDVLTELGLILKSCSRSRDIVARYGGEEFVIILRDTSIEEAEKIGEKIRRAVEKMKVENIDRKITISIGLSHYPSNSLEKEELVERADQALYYSKKTGKNKLSIWNSKMDNIINRADKLAGILTGNTSDDNRNILAMLDIVNLIKENKDIEDKIYLFLGRLLETINAEKATILLPAEYKKGRNVFTRTRFKDGWIPTPKLNFGKIATVVGNGKGEFLIDWDSFENVDYLSGLPNWESIIVIPMIKSGDLVGILYISVPINIKEFTFNCYNIAESFAKLFAAML